jgi:putative ABC transport system permease protein
VGVLPPDFRFPKNNDLGPLARLAERTDAFLPIRSYAQGWEGEYDYIVFGRLRLGVTESQGRAELDLLERRIVENYRGNIEEGLRVQTWPLQDVIASPVRASLMVLLSAVLVLALIVCVNLANLLLARGSARTREYVMRIALGASRGRLVIAALIETLLLSLAGGILGTVGALTTVSAFARVAPIDLPRADEARVDSPVVGFDSVSRWSVRSFSGCFPPSAFRKPIRKTRCAARVTVPLPAVAACICANGSWAARSRPARFCSFSPDYW